MASFATVHSDDEILAFIEAARPDLVAIDAPLNLRPAEHPLRIATENTSGPATANSSSAASGSFRSPSGP